MTSICAECGASVASMPQHMKVHDKRKFECEVCDELVVGRTNFANHKQTHKTWTCPKCSMVIPHNSRTMHMKKCLHKKLKEFKCDKCPYVTTNKSNLDRHGKTHDKQASEIECTQCGETFANIMTCS